MTTDKEAAAAYRLLAEYHQSEHEAAIPGAKSSQAQTFTERADELDPPAPTHADGTVAWVTDRMGTRWISVRNNGQWDSRSGDVTRDGFGYTGIVKVEPLRVLAADEIAIKRPGYLSRRASEMLRDAEFSTSADLLESIREAFAALDAEAGGAK